MKKDYTVLLIQLDGNFASDVSTRCSGHPQGGRPEQPQVGRPEHLVETSEAKFPSS